MRKLIINILLFTIAVTAGCSENLLTEFAKDDTDEALLIAAKIHMNNSEWDLAIDEFEAMSAGFRSDRGIVLQEAKAYAGKCGIRLLGLFEELAANLASGRLFPILMEALTGADSAAADACIAAEGLITGISSTASLRTVQENTTLAFVAFGKIGAILAAFADDNATTGGDGAVDADFNGCDNTAAVGLTDDYVKQVGTGITIGNEALAQAIADGGDVGGDELSSLANSCSELATNYPANDFCANTHVDDFDQAAEVLGIRFMINDTTVIGIGGVEACDITAALDCLCP